MKNNLWRIEVKGGGQIADTGDYGDPIYMLTNGDIELVTKDEVDTEYPEIHVLTEVLNQYKWEDWKLSDKEYELYLANKELNQCKEIAGKLYKELKTCLGNNIDQYQYEIMKEYEQAIQ